MAYVEKEIEKIYWSIGEVAEMFSVNTSKIRFYEMEFQLAFKKNRVGDRKFTLEDIEALRVIIFLTDRFKMEYVKTLIYHNRTQAVVKFLESIEAKKEDVKVVATFNNEHAAD